MTRQVNVVALAIARANTNIINQLFVHDNIRLKHHVDGAVRMVELNGGPGTLGVNGLLEQLLRNLLDKFEKHFGSFIES
jgi:hypothetical protein